MRLRLILWSLAAVLAVAVAAEWNLPLGTEAAVPAVRVVPAAPRAASTREPLGEWAAAVLQRPLFNPDRRPAPLGAEAPSTAAARPDLPRLAGVMLTREGGRAIFAADGGGAATVASEGATIGDWRIESIRAEGVLVAGPGGEKMVRPSYSDVPAQASALPPPPPGLLPGLPFTDTRPFSTLAQPSGAAIFRNAPLLPVIRTSP